MYFLTCLLTKNYVKPKHFQNLLCVKMLEIFRIQFLIILFFLSFYFNSVYAVIVDAASTECPWREWINLTICVGNVTLTQLFDIRNQWAYNRSSTYICMYLSIFILRRIYFPVQRLMTMMTTISSAIYSNCHFKIAHRNWILTIAQRIFNARTSHICYGIIPILYSLFIYTSYGYIYTFWHSGISVKYLYCPKWQWW